MSDDALRLWIEVCRTRIKVLVLFFLLPGIASLLWSAYLIPRTWAARTTLMPLVTSTMSAALSAELRAALPLALPRSGDINLIYNLLTSRDIAETVMEECNLVPVLSPQGKRAAALERLQDSINVRVTDNNLIIVSVNLGGTPRGIFSPSADREVRQLVATIANQYVHQLSARLESAHYSQAKRQREFIGKRLANTRQELRQAEEQLANFRAAHELYAPSQQSSALATTLGQLEREKRSANIRLWADKARLAAATNQLSTQQQMKLQALTSERDPGLDSIEAKLVDAQVQLVQAQQVEGKSDRHPDVRRLRESINYLQTQLQQRLSAGMIEARKTESLNAEWEKLSGEIVTLILDRESTAARLAAIQKTLNSLRKEAQALPDIEKQYVELKRAVEIKNSVLKTLAQQYEMARIKEAEQAVGFQIIDEAIPPQCKTSPSVGFNSVIASLSGLLIGLITMALLVVYSEAKNSSDPA